MIKSKRKLRNTLRQMTMKTQPYKIYSMKQKQALEVSSQRYWPSSKNKKNLKQPNLPPKRIRKRRTNKT